MIADVEREKKKSRPGTVWYCAVRCDKIEGGGRGKNANQHFGRNNLRSNAALTILNVCREVATVSY